MITLLAAFIALLWSRKAKKSTTLWATVLLAISSAVDYLPFLKEYDVGYYLFAFFSVFAGIESQNSLRLNKAHRLLFAATPLVIAFFLLIQLIALPYYIPKYPFAIIYILALLYFWFSSRRKIFSRFGILVVWLALAMKWLLPVLR
ncbi:hypothetical protein [Roseivirga sp.]|uniref:hypothetical protein n=1 Tax=Roseivirga sp. TaxID=1964215 RepID=UPI003B8AB75E